MPSLNEKRLFNIIGAVYDNALNSGSAHWLDIFRDMADLFRSRGGAFMAYDKRDTSFHIIETTCENVLVDEYNQYYQFINPLQPAIEALKPFMRINRQEMIDDGQFKKLEVFEDFYRRVDHFHVEYRVLLDDDTTHAGVSFSRDVGEPNFSARELSAMTYLMPHLARGFKVYFNLLEAHRQNTMLEKAFDGIPHGVIVVDRDRKPVFANTAASEMLEAGNGILVDRQGRLETLFANKTFYRVVSNLFDRHAHEADKYGGVISVERPPELRPLELLISRFRYTGPSSFGSESLAIIYITDPEQKTPDSLRSLVQMYRLTPAEARLAKMLADGRSLADACADMKIAVNTGRSHLKRVFFKTGTDRQAALVKLVLNGAANIRRHEKNAVSNPFG